MDIRKKSRAWVTAIACGTAVFISATPVVAAPQDESVFAETAVEEAGSQENVSMDTGQDVTEENKDPADETAEAQETETPESEYETEESDESGDESSKYNEEENEDESDIETIEETQKDTYTAPENTSHVNVSFTFSNSSRKLTYPVTLGLKEVDTGVRQKVVLRSEGQIVEMEHGDYQITSIKDSGKMPLRTGSKTYEIYKNTSYAVPFVENRGKKMFGDFLKDNVFLVIFFAAGAALYNATIIKNFNKHPRR